MRQITVKYQGNCKQCDTVLEVGTQAMYEKSMGIFCLGHEPTGTEEIRAYRQEKADIKADSLEDWAEKREERAEAQLNSYLSMRHDWAFITQPGHIPARARMIKADDRAFESLEKAKGMRERAENLRNVRVAGDAERERQAKREAADKIISIGTFIFCALYGTGDVVKVNQKTYRVNFGNHITNVDKAWCIKKED